jgi:hypothetical protein
MLASTVQFSNNNPPPSHHDPTRPRPSTTNGRSIERSGIRNGPDREKSPTPQPRQSPSSRQITGWARSLRTQQRAYDHPTVPDPAPHPPPEEGRVVLGAGQRPAAELVSVPPSSTTPHTRRPPTTGGAIQVQARLCTDRRGLPA